MTERCNYSTGSISGCRPLCDQPATHNVRILDYPRVDQFRCAAHVQATTAATYPYRYVIEEVTS